MLHHTVYDHSGLRKTKVVNGQTTQYEYEGGKLITETRSDGRKLYFQYSGDTLIGFDLLENGNTYSYFYKRDAKGEIVGMLDFWGTKVASYYYDAYGQVVSMKDHGGNEVKDASTHLGNLNPFKFKAYYYDYEAKWYYLQSRYYAPGVCRFLNADAIIQRTSLTGTNMFAYCNNNPIVYADYDG